MFGLLLGLLLGAAPGCCRNKAILIDCSFQYENYRHAVNVRALQSLLEKNGFLPSDLAVFIKDDLLADPRNHWPHLYLSDSTVLRRGTDYTPIGRSSSYFDILNLLAGEDPALVGADSTTNLLIYLTGHGGDGFIKYCNREYFFAEDITRALLKLQAIRRLGQVLFISDTCQADTLVNLAQLPPNVFFVSTSLKGESSHSVNFAPSLNVHPVDLFIAHFYDLERSGAFQTTQDFGALSKTVFPTSTVYSTVTVHGDFVLSDFIYQRDPPASLYL